MLSQKFVINVIFGHVGRGLPAIVYVKPKIFDQWYFSYYSPLPASPIKKKKKKKKEQCTIINTMCIVVKNLYALYVQLSEPLNNKEFWENCKEQSGVLGKLSRINQNWDSSFTIRDSGTIPERN